MTDAQPRSLDPHSAFTGLLEAPIENVATDLTLLLMAVAIGFSFAAIGYIRAAIGTPPHQPSPIASTRPHGLLRRRSF